MGVGYQSKMVSRYNKFVLADDRYVGCHYVSDGRHQIREGMGLL